MPQISIKGRQPQKVTYEAAVEIKKLFDDPSVSYMTPIPFAKFSIRKEDIKSVSLFDEQDEQKEKMEIGNSLVSKTENEHQKNIDRLLFMSPSARAQDTEFFAMYFQALTTQQPTAEERAEAASAQEAYFAEHRQALADPAIFVPIVKRSGKGRDLEGFSILLFDIVKRAYYASVDRLSSREFAIQKSLGM